jgi:hypothetical protein
MPKSIKVTLYVLVLVLVNGCNFFPEFKTGSKKPQNVPFSNFDYKNISSVTLSVHLPETDVNFTADLKYTGPEESDWQIQSTQLTDRNADGFYIRHLLDTVHTMHIAGDAPFENSQLSDLGLSPPRYAIRWTQGESPVEVRIGNKLKNDNQAYAFMPGKEKPVIVGGAIIKMLDYLKSFDTLRQKTFVRFTADDIDQIQIYKRENQKRKQIFNAERYSKIWKKKQIDKHLESFTHARVQMYIDDVEFSSQLEKQIQKQPLAELVAIDRQGHPITVKIGKRNDLIYGITSERPHAAFLLPNEITRYFQIEK